MNILINTNKSYTLSLDNRAGSTAITQAQWDSIVAFNTAHINELQYARIDVITLIPYVDTATQLLDAQKSKEAEIRQACAHAIDMIAVPYPQQERDTWFKQAAEAEAWTAINTAATPMIDAMLAARQVNDPTATKLGIVNNILAKRDLFNAAVGTQIGKQQGLLAKVYAANATKASVQAITW